MQIGKIKNVCSVRTKKISTFSASFFIVDYDRFHFISMETAGKYTVNAGSKATLI